LILLVESFPEKIIYKDSIIIITNKNLHFVSSKTSISLKDIKRVSIKRFDSILLTTNEKEIPIPILRGSWRLFDQTYSLLIGSGFEAGSWQEESAAATAHIASILTMALYLYGEPESFLDSKTYRDYNEMIESELTPEGYLWCRSCEEFIEVNKNGQDIWTINCPKCGNKTLLSKKPL